MNTYLELISMEHLSTPEMLIEFAVLIHLKVKNKNHTTLFSLWILISTLHGSWFLLLRWTSIFLYIYVCVCACFYSIAQKIGFTCNHGFEWHALASYYQCVLAIFCRKQSFNHMILTTGAYVKCIYGHSDWIYKCYIYLLCISPTTGWNGTIISSGESGILGFW